ncbi:MAG: hypothetical protein PHQ42_02080 [Patescibacteria group bacterium]|nr:hypothetical protein [Patescibacteria group bacterium]
MKTGLVGLLSRIGITPDSKPHGSGFQGELVKVFIGFIRTEMAKGQCEEALGIFKTVLIFDSRPDLVGFAERVLEGAPIFAALVAKMAVDEIINKFDVEREKARELKTLAEKYAEETRRAEPI